MRAKIETQDRYKALFLSEQGYSLRQIAEQLGRPHSCVSNILKRYNETGCINDRRRTGRNKIANARDIRVLINLVKKKRTASSTVLANSWETSSGASASPRTMRKILQEHNYLWRSAVKKPRLTKKQKFARMEFCKKYKSWPKSMWHQVIFSDEMNIEVDKRKGRVMLRRTPQERFSESCIVKRTKQGSGSIGLWACMNYQGIGFFKIFTGRLNSERYYDILGEYLLPAIDQFQQEGEKLIFQQDNAPCHTAKIINNWFDEQKIERMKWPANSPDLNCIENLWSWLDSELAKFTIYSVQELTEHVTRLMSNVPLEIVHALVDSMPNRLQECLRVKGGSTRY